MYTITNVAVPPPPSPSRVPLVYNLSATSAWVTLHDLNTPARGPTMTIHLYKMIQVIEPQFEILPRNNTRAFISDSELPEI